LRTTFEVAGLGKWITDTWEGRGSWAERFAVNLLYRSGIPNAAARFYAGRGAIIMFHSVVPSRHLCIDTDLRTTPEFLDRLLSNLRASNIDVVSLNDVPELLRAPNGRRFVVFTFDDGYRDNFIHALPVFEKHGAPFTIYVASGMLTGTLNCWWLGLERLFLLHSTVEIDAMQRQWSLTSLRSRARAYREACNWVIQDTRVNIAALGSTFVRYGIDLQHITREVGLTIDQFRALAQHELVTIGGHTVTHPDLGQLSHSEAYQEIIQDKLFLEALGDIPIDHFAYPFGTARTCGPREAYLARQAGYRTATTTWHDCLTDPLNQDLLQLPRVGINRPYESIGLARLQIDGLTAALHRQAVNKRRTLPPSIQNQTST
jgi:peptidoglycan/xylan/chitin deacetylase (PgdA/CDA1 family)